MPNKEYRSLGYGILIASVLWLVDLHYQLVWALLAIPNFRVLLGVFFKYILPPPERFLASVDGVLSTSLALWGIIVSIQLIRRGYTRQIFFFVWSFVILKGAYFLLAAGVGKFEITAIMDATIAYYFLLYRNDKWSRLVRGKTNLATPPNFPPPVENL